MANNKVLDTMNRSFGVYNDNIWKLNERMMLFLFNREKKSGLSFLYLFYIHPSSLVFYAVFYISQFIMTVDKSASRRSIEYHMVYLYSDLSKEKSTIIFNGRKLSVSFFSFLFYILWVRKDRDSESEWKIWRWKWFGVQEVCYKRKR